MLTTNMHYCLVFGTCHYSRLYWCCYQTMIVSILIVQEVSLCVMCGDYIGVQELACSIVLLLTLLLTI